MAQGIPGRFTAQIDSPFVVFIIGMRANRLIAPRRWVPTFLAMPRMLAELAGRNAIMIQYWRSFEALHRFARDPPRRTCRPGGASTAPWGRTAASASGT